MVLKNSIIEKLATEGKITYIPAKESKKIYDNLIKRGIEYKRKYKRKEFYSHIAASELVLNS
ncbi:MAG TPA: hypothetical protein PLE51_00900 [Candidatus Pacearchaeota archaeon]|nr:hypothetical protein [Candidatus Pacearchaeota archaeon]HOR52205.1 hypothetical protein [Candidatus Pacearchaeota archaeon]HPJ87068.1 hypothetical protein [Candidatus Pacearchaeota archaeon]HQJ58002.1 hypothetical protein [Candidatus Pacearchaeota archaeon]